MSSIRAKFRVSAVHNTNGVEELTLSAVYSPDPASENYSWSQYTPWGELRMAITNVAAQGKFRHGDEVQIDITNLSHIPEGVMA